MLSSGSVSPVREILEGRFSKLLPELESELDGHLGEVCRRARWELADHLNQAARRIQHAAGASDIGATLVEAASAFSAGVALLSIAGSEARGECIRGTSEECTAGFPDLIVPLDQAPALAEVVRNRDPVTAVATPGEISGGLARVLTQGTEMPERVFLYPVTAAGRVPAVLFAWGEVQGPPLELLTQIAAAAWPAPPASPELVQLAAVPASAPASAWDALSGDEQQIHLQAQRAARVEVAQMRLFQGEAVESGRGRRDLYAALGPRIDAARESFRQRYFSATPTMVDYLHLELLRTLAHDDADLLGKDYPGPLA